MKKETWNTISNVFIFLGGVLGFQLVMGLTETNLEIRLTTGIFVLIGSLIKIYLYFKKD